MRRMSTWQKQETVTRWQELFYLHSKTVGDHSLL